MKTSNNGSLGNSDGDGLATPSLEDDDGSAMSFDSGSTTASDVFTSRHLLRLVCLPIAF